MVRTGEPERRGRGGRSASRLTPALAALLLLAACGQAHMMATMGRVRARVMRRDYAGALAALRAAKKEGFKEQDRVVYWMNEGMLLHLVHRYRESNAVLEKAERRVKELFTLSIRKQVAAAFTSQASTDYQGEDYEKVMLNVIKAFNYLMLGDVEAAGVEARRINEKLAYFNTQYKHKNVYNQDAFALWLSGLLHEMNREYDDARIDFVKSIEVYRDAFEPTYGLGMPDWLPEDAARAALLSGDRETAARLRRTYKVPDLGSTREALRERGELVLVLLNGEGPSKGDFFVTCWARNVAFFVCDFEPGGEFMRKTRVVIPPDGTVVRIAFPELHLREPRNPFVEVRAAGEAARSQPVLPINAIARKTLADKMHRIFRDAIVRAITKALTQEAAGAVGKAIGGKDKGAGQVLGWLLKSATSAAMQATEEADKRTWSTLPAGIDVARLLLPPGTHAVRLSFPRGGSVTLPGVKIRPGRRTFITFRAMP